MKNQLLKRIGIIALVLALACGLLAGCGGAAGDDATATGGSAATAAPAGESGESTAADSDAVITMAMGSAWADLIPYNAASGGYYSGLVLGLLYDRLFYIDDTGAITPRNADSWEIADDMLSVTFHLNKDAKWSDGEPVTANDYVFAAQMITDPDCIVNQKSAYNILVGTDDSGNADGSAALGAEATDDYTLTYTFKGPINEAVTFTSYIYLYQAIPYHILKDTAPADYLTAANWSAPVCNGPLTFESTIPGSELIMTANKDYYLGAPKFAKFKIEVMATTNMASAIIAGDVDIAYPPMSVDDIDALEGADGVTVVHLDVATQPYMLFVNQMVYPDKRIRQAIDKAIDRDAIVGMLQRAASIESPILSSTEYYDPSVVPDYDPDAAKALLAEAAADGAIDLSQPITICTPSGVREKCASIIQQNLEAIGLTVNVQVEEAATMFAGFYDGTTGIGLVNMTMQSNPMYLRNMLTNDSATFINNTSDIWDDYYDEFMEATSDEARVEIVKEFQQSWLDEVPIVFYAGTYEDYAYNSRLGSGIGMEDIGYGNLPVWEWTMQG